MGYAMPGAKTRASRTRSHSSTATCRAKSRWSAWRYSRAARHRGSGDKIYKDADFVAEIQRPRRSSPEIVTVKKGTGTEANQVDAITGATISSKAVVRIVNETACGVGRTSCRRRAREPPHSGAPAGERNGVMTKKRILRRTRQGNLARQPRLRTGAGHVPDARRHELGDQRRRDGRGDGVRAGGLEFPRIDLPQIIPKQVRISAYIIIIATFVTIADYTLQAMVPNGPQGARRVHLADRRELPDPRPAGGFRIPLPHPARGRGCTGHGRWLPARTVIARRRPRDPRRRLVVRRSGSSARTSSPGSS